jgi:hypothetical protein
MERFDPGFALLFLDGIPPVSPNRHPSLLKLLNLIQLLHLVHFTFAIV